MTKIFTFVTLFANFGDKMETIQDKIEKKIGKKREINLIFPGEFRGMASDDAIRQAMSRLTKKGILKRLASGIYYLPETDPILGEIRPSVDDVVSCIAKKERIRIKPAGAFALNQLGLTTQVPMRRVYITDGHPRQFKIGKLQIKFKPTTPKRLSRTGKISSLVIQALEELGTTHIDTETSAKLRELLLKEDPKILMQDLKLSTGKVSSYILKLLKENEI